MTRPARRDRLAPAVAALLLAACSAATQAAPSSSQPSPSRPPVDAAGGSALPPTAVATASTSAWEEDLATIDRSVRTFHVSPFTIHPESEWVARLKDVSENIDTAMPNQQIAMVASLIGLLDTHSSFVEIPGGWHFYGLLPYRFSDGWFVVNAADHALIGDRLVSIGGVPIDRVVERLTPLVPHDNEDGLLMGLLWEINAVEYLNGSGIVPDPTHPAFELRKPDGTTVTIDPPVQAEGQYDLVNPGWLTGMAPEAVARRRQLIWTKLDEAHHVILVSVNDYGDMMAAGGAMTAALDAKQADRVVFDMRYLPGGNGDIAILDTLKNDPRVNRPGGLTVLIGRENVSAATSVVEFLDTQTNATFVGEPTPARADNFRCDCREVVLSHSGFTISVPTSWDRLGDDRPEIAPDVPMALSSTDFFAGRDPVLEAALSGRFPPAP
jgi:hypothetical protein